MTSLASVELGEVAAFVRGITFKPDDVLPVGTPGTAACMRTKNVQAELDLSDVWGIPEGFVRREDQYLIPGDMLVSSANSWNLVGKCCWVPDLPWRSTFGGFISVLRPNPAKVDPRYLFRWFTTDRTQATVRSFGQQTTNISNLNVDRCLKLKLRLPPLPEQRRLAKILDKADALRAKRRAALAQLDTLSQAIFLDMFGDPATNPKGWQKVPVRDLARQIRGVTYAKEEASAEKKPGHILLLRAGNISAGEVVLDDLVYVLAARVAPDQMLRRNDILVAASSGSLDVVGKAARVEEDIDAGFGAFCKVLRPGTAVDPDFFAAFFGTQHYRRRVSELAAGVNINNLRSEHLDNFLVPLPPTDLQKEFAATTAVTRNMKARLRESLAHLDALFAVVQHRAFWGEL